MCAERNFIYEYIDTLDVPNNLIAPTYKNIIAKLYIAMNYNGAVDLYRQIDKMCCLHPDWMPYNEGHLILIISQHVISNQHINVNSLWSEDMSLNEERMRHGEILMNQVVDMLNKEFV